jgi:2-oxoglutarate ferredoxin oxidoreductase subunit alpha
MMLEDVHLAVKGRVPIEFYGRLGGVTPFPDEILEEIVRIHENPPTTDNGQVMEQWLERLENNIRGGR